MIYTAVILASYSHIYLACLDMRCQVEVAKLVKTTGLYIPYYRITSEKKKTCVRTICNFFFGFIRQAYLEIMAETKRAARNSETMGTSAWWVFKVSLELCVSAEPVEVT